MDNYEKRMEKGVVKIKSSKESEKVEKGGKRKWKSGEKLGKGGKKERKEQKGANLGLKPSIFFVFTYPNGSFQRPIRPDFPRRFRICDQNQQILWSTSPKQRFKDCFWSKLVYFLII